MDRCWLLVVEMVLPVGIAPTTRRFEAGRSDLLSYGSLDEMVRWAVLPNRWNSGPGWVRTINLPIQSRALF